MQESLKISKFGSSPQKKMLREKKRKVELHFKHAHVRF